MLGLYGVAPTKVSLDDRGVVKINHRILLGWGRDGGLKLYMTEAELH